MVASWVWGGRKSKLQTQPTHGTVSTRKARVGAEASVPGTAPAAAAGLSPAPLAQRAVRPERAALAVRAGDLAVVRVHSLAERDALREAGVGLVRGEGRGVSD
jgi:hypothetical protein